MKFEQKKSWNFMIRSWKSHGILSRRFRGNPVISSNALLLLCNCEPMASQGAALSLWWLLFSGEVVPRHMYLVLLGGYCNSWEHAGSRPGPGASPPGRPLLGSTSGKRSFLVKVVPRKARSIPQGQRPISVCSRSLVICSQELQ